MGGLASRRATFEAAVQLVFDAVFLVVEVVHDGREDGGFDFPHLGGGIFLS